MTAHRGPLDDKPRNLLTPGEMQALSLIQRNPYLDTPDPVTFEWTIPEDRVMLLREDEEAYEAYWIRWRNYWYPR